MGFDYPPDSPVTLINADTFQAFIDKHSRVFIHCGAAWNGYDKMLIAPVVHAARQLQDKIHFAVMDVDVKENWPLLAEHGMLNIPYFEYYEDGKRIEARTGYDVAMNKLALLTKKTP